MSPAEAPALLLPAVCTAADAARVMRRRLPAARTSVTAVHHPFWWIRSSVVRRSLLRSTPLPSRIADVLVDAYSGKGFLASFVPHGEEFESAAFRAGLERDPLSPQRAVDIARDLVAAKARKTFKLGIDFRIECAPEIRGVLKPNWLVSGANEEHSAEFLVDGLNGSHYVISARKTASVV